MHACSDFSSDPLTVQRSRAKTDGLYLMILGSVAFVLLGFAIIYVRHTDMMDFRSAYLCAKCLTQQCDPYKQSDILGIYVAGGSPLPSTDSERETLDHETLNVYLPTASTLTVPFALLPYRLALALWLSTIAASFIFACFLMWDLASAYTHVLPAALLCVYMILSGSLISSANAGAIALSLCVIAAWCFVKERFVTAGIVCLAASLALKPHDSFLVLFFLLCCGGLYRKRALQSLGLLCIFTIPVILWVMHTSPHWFSELHNNMLAHYSRGGVDDPGPATALNRGAFVITDLQAVFSFFRDDPDFYNYLSYAVCTLLLLALIVPALRKRPSLKLISIGLAVVAPLSMLPVYHRQYDARLLILTIPACALLWAEGGRIGKLAVLIETIGLLLTGDISWSLYRNFLFQVPAFASGRSTQLLIILLAFPVPLILLALCCFYLCVYLQRVQTPDGA